MNAPFNDQFFYQFLHALNNGDVVPYYQSKHDLISSKIIGFEVLARWNHPTSGVLTPVAFYSAFDEPVLAPKLTQCIMRQSLEDYAVWKAKYAFSGRLSLNVTSHDLGVAGFADMFLELLEGSSVAPYDATLEVTEHVVLGADDGLVFKTLEALRREGVQIALDDFGTGYGGLQHLRCWPVDRLKLDCTFTKDIATSFPDYAIVRAISQLATELGMTVIAEGIETKEQLRELKKVGVPFGQGYYFSAPVCAADVDGLLATQ